MTVTHSGSSRGRVLVVDDDAALAEMLGIVLRGEGFEPVFCADGAEALGAFRDTKPDLVLLDLMLPGDDGLTLCRNLRARSEVPVINGIVVTNSREQAVARCQGQTLSYFELNERANRIGHGRFRRGRSQREVTLIRRPSIAC